MAAIQIVTADELREKFGTKAINDLADRDRNGTADTAVLNNALDVASETVKDHMPLIARASVAGITRAKNFALKLAYYELRSNEEQTMTAECKALFYDEPMRELRAIAAGKIEVGEGSSEIETRPKYRPLAGSTTSPYGLADGTAREGF